MSDLISRQAAIDAHYEYCNKHPDAGFPVWSLKILEGLPSAQPETHGKRMETHACDLIDRQAAIDALERIFDQCEEIEAHFPDGDPDKTGYKMFPDYMTVWKYLHQLSSAQPERMTNRQWIDFLSAQFDISRTSAKEMLHRMMQWKKEDNFKKLFNGSVVREA